MKPRGLAVDGSGNLFTAGTFWGTADMDPGPGQLTFVANQNFELMRQVAPHRTKGLEIFSTNLWHLRKQVELAYLAQSALELDRSSPESWCVVGNFAPREVQRDQ